MPLKVNIGLPQKKRKFDLLSHSDDMGDCVLVKNFLYVLHNTYKDGGNESVNLNRLDLNNFNGDLGSADVLYQSNIVNTGFLLSSENLLLLAGGAGLVFDPQCAQTCIFRESNVNEVLSWSDYYACFTVGDIYVRQIDAQIPEKGMDLVSIQSSLLIGHIDADFDVCAHLGDGLIGGNRVNNNFAIFSIKDNRFVFELDSEKYFNCIPGSRIHFSRCESRLALAYNDSVVVLNLDSFEVIHHINCLKAEPIQAAIKQYSSKESKLMINDIYFSGDKVIVNGGRRISYVMCLDLTEEDDLVQWVYQGFGSNHIKYVGGDLIFGIQEDRPVAWDIYAGEIVWEASAGTIAKKIQVGDGWLVYSSLAGYIQCFQWKKPYISPHRPSV